eukprot:c518_g1_i1.p1 GENE.c518_g1_i1~~c518_g1_i1.p1  ORF type:complete len:451 (-),score=122.06 c518_g1_i1:78-1358(-)
MEFLSSMICGCLRARPHSEAVVVGEELPKNTTIEDITFAVSNTNIALADFAGPLLMSRDVGMHKLKERWFVLKNDLYYFKSDSDLVPRGIVVLGCDLFEPRVDVFSTDDYDHVIGIRYAFTKFLRAETREDAIRWVVAFQKAGITCSVASELYMDDPEPQVVAGDLDGNEVICEGYLMKRGFSNVWKKYWFKLRPSTLEHYHSPTDGECKGTINLFSEDMTTEIAMPPFMARGSSDGFSFRITHPRRLFLVARDQNALAEWHSSIRATTGQQVNSKMLMQKNPTGWKRSGKIREIVVHVVEFLRDPTRLEYLRRFLRMFECEHYLKFWLDVQQFKRLCKKEDAAYLLPCAKVIFNKYIVPGGVYELDLPDEVRELSAQALKQQVDANTFKESQEHILMVITNFYFPLFLTSPMCHEMADAFTITSS